MKKLFLLVGIFLCIAPYAVAGTLSCSVGASCPSGTVIWRMSATTNAHAELPSQSNYAQLVCCTGVTGLGNACSGTFAIALKLSATTNGQSEQNSQSNYNNNACIQAPSGGSVSVGYQASNCTGFDTTLGSISATTNGHTGDGTAYTTKICATAAVGGSQTLTFSISDNSIGFGTLNTAAARFATGDTTGSATEVEAHTLSASTNASNGYTITVKGATLTHATNGSFTILAIGGTNTVSSVGTEQFGLRMTASGGSGTVTSPYAASGFAYAGTASTASQVASLSNGDGVTTTYSVRYIANIASTTEAGSYSANLIYVATGNF